METRNPRDARRIVPVAEATMTGPGHLKEAVTELRFTENGSPAFTVRSDEPGTVGGEDRYPSPILYFAGAVAMCLLTQITRVSQARRTPIEDTTVTAEVEMRQQGSFLRGDARSWSEEVRVSVDIESDADPDEIETVLELAERTCFVEASIAESVPIRHSLRINGQSRD